MKIKVDSNKIVCLKIDLKNMEADIIKVYLKIK